MWCNSSFCGCGGGVRSLLCFLGGVVRVLCVYSGVFFFVLFCSSFFLLFLLLPPQVTSRVASHGVGRSRSHDDNDS